MKTKEEQQKYADVLKDFKETFIDHPENRAIEFGLNGHMRCVYRSDDGKKCAVGKYIPENSYSNDFEEKSVGDIYEDIKYCLPVDDYGFWAELQRLHDDHPNSFETRTYFDRKDKSFTICGKDKFNDLINEFCPDFQELKFI